MEGKNKEGSGLGGYQLEEKRLRQKDRLRMALRAAVTVAAVLLSFWIGYYPLSPAEVVRAMLAGWGIEVEVIPQAVTIFWQVRLPRILAALLIGGALAVSGAAYQGMFRNPLVSPDILGVSSGAGMGAALAIGSGLPGWCIQLFACVGGALAVGAACLIGARARENPVLSLVLTGTMVGSLCNAVVTLVKYFSDPNDVLQQLTFWLMGSLTKVDLAGVLTSAVPMAAGFAVLFAMRWRINLLSLGDEEAQSLGMSLRRDRLTVILAATLLSASAVCLGGLIGWVGLMIPHLCRAVFGPDGRRMIPACALMGGAYLLLMDDIARSAMQMELPIGVVTAVAGVPFFIWLMVGRRGAFHAA